jgi:hypothetical protein
MNNGFSLNLSIADINELLTKALADYVLRQDGYRVGTVDWDSREMCFRIKLEPVKQEALSMGGEAR